MNVKHFGMCATAQRAQAIDFYGSKRANQTGTRMLHERIKNPISLPLITVELFRVGGICLPHLYDHTARVSEKEQHDC